MALTDIINFKDFSIKSLQDILEDDVKVLNPDDFKNDIHLTISDYIDFGVTTGSENLYFDIIVYKLDSVKPYKLKLMTKDNHKGLKTLICHIINVW